MPEPSSTASLPWANRPARRDECEAIVNFQIAMACESEALELDRETVRCGVAAVFEHPQRGQYWVTELPSAADGDTPALAGCLLTINEWSDWRNGTVLWIHSVYVAPTHRRQGVFRAMYRHLETMVRRDATLHGLRLFVDKRNHAAQRTYTSLGMSNEHYDLFEWLKD